MYSSARKLPSAEILNELLTVDPSSPTGLTWKVNRRGTVKAGTVAGTLQRSSTSGAVMYQVGYKGRKLQVHRVIWKMVNGSDPINVIDHIDNNPLNNNISNLRDVTQRENSLNRKDRKISA